MQCGERTVCFISSIVKESLSICLHMWNNVWTVLNRWKSMQCRMKEHECFSNTPQHKKSFNTRLLQGFRFNLRSLDCGLVVFRFSSLFSHIQLLSKVKYKNNWKINLWMKVGVLCFFFFFQYLYISDSFVYKIKKYLLMKFE